MRKIMTTAVFILAILLISNYSAAAQHGYTIEKPLKFAAGKNSAVLKSRLKSRLETHTYILKIETGKTLYVQLESKNAQMSFMVLDPADEKIGDAASEYWDWEGELTETGEYRILVHAIRGGGNYALTVEVK